MKIYLDIETLPADGEILDLVKTTYENLIKDKKIKKTTFEEYHRATSFNGDFGRIYCIAYAINDEKVKVLTGDEKEILTKFWQIAQSVKIFIGHNIMEFDLPFIYKRSIIHNVKPSQNLFFARYRNDPIYDTMREWNKWSSNLTSLDRLAKIFKITSSKDIMKGSEVYDYYLKNQHSLVYKYCQKDVEVTRNVYKKLNFL
ncbi:hypothetical protein COY43_00390 [Candidatus Berkelbacteria bacterium CG_4_10_14_0_8_um_filter_35_9_33_8]|uniref:Predicted 3'-5' exonuclease PolB-like domain-containing protein n=1 Tax=Candidatus Berkelbacteria bacterium CG_4_10_14_0_2_um_filter_35_9_33_12 TaxID=1974499 RepID=A0A2M7W3P7_9BACT|nr:MAG: hypothetical protein COX10_02100 [Candidatus Berkelbacteria bacterium CG23_combo_of_CG06-09_8_20_14_all_33_15]PIS08226.1 MAG: hypothetical protein COT76_02555 [Candidatus Berkelbacteria bacterium CG10_big_fil_rev_8_21_14_0_10_33_10]PIZ28443.1 MAG: hypothetical protein COY43_00390 [Candidatus Berkelbacteria bacterium CG_4_10_14_0_8_um_filter_35_9_33_8]PJA20119.1 MAG: hypothetical protein COX60_02620 [Candidatus Berkelbacteria bacterium CG_4_10_14_0_2_um_filter_35_9_33_12]PJB52103.1 MAG: 